MVIHKSPNLHSFWNKSFVFSNRIPEIMSRDYFCLILKALHLPENNFEYIEDETESEISGDEMDFEETDEFINDPRYKIEFFLEELIKNSKKYFKLGKNITIDETMIFFRGRSLMRFYLPAKPHKWGFKLHSLVDSCTYYIFDPGKQYKSLITPDPNNSFAYQIVITLVNRLN